MQPDPTLLLSRLEIAVPPIGLYDAPDPALFEPLVQPKPGRRRGGCMFSFYQKWLQGETLHLTRDNTGCRGGAHWLFDEPTPPRDEFIRFLADDEGLKASHELMNLWLDNSQPYRPEYPHLLIGQLRPQLYPYLKTITFFVNPDQLGALMLGAQYHAAPSDPAPVIAPFGSGCMQFVSLFEDLGIPQAMVGSMDIAMRQYLPLDMIAFTVTKPMFERVCALDERSFLYKPFWERLQKARNGGSS